MKNSDAIKILKMVEAHGILTKEAKELAIKALEEVQRYRALGTPEDLKAMKEHGAFTGTELAQLAAMQMRLREYERIGTPKEFRAAMEKQNVNEELESHDEKHILECCISLMQEVVNEFAEWYRWQTSERKQLQIGTGGRTMRLIDADKVIDHLEKVKKESRSLVDVAYIIGFQSVIDVQPTAYDPDKVVEQLEEVEKIMTSPVNIDCFGEECRASDCTVCLISKAIEIVKSCEQEQKSECEWKLEDVEQNLYVTECVNRHLIFEGTPEENGYKYCPYCGRKIKRGGVYGN